MPNAVLITRAPETTMSTLGRRLGAGLLALTASASLFGCAAGARMPSHWATLKTVNVSTRPPAPLTAG